MSTTTASAVPPSRSFDEALPFRFVGGDPSFDLVNTVTWTSQGPINDRLGSYERLIEWAREAGVIDDAEATRRLRRASARPAEAKAAYEQSRALRWTLQRLVTALANGGTTTTAVRAPLAEFNKFVAEAYGHLRLAIPGGRSADGSPTSAWEWSDAPDRLDAVLWPIVRGAAELLASNEVRQFRVCTGPDCGWVYVDRSRNGLRRWCEMSTCGTAEKTRRRRARSG